MTRIRIATRKSPLALWQADHVKHLLTNIYPDVDIELIKITSKGDQFINQPLADIGGKALFVKELEDALLNDHADIAVHSIKDVPAELPNGLALGATCKRGNPQDVLVSNDYANLDALPLGSCVGTSSLRRQSQLLALRPDLKIIPIRGNIHTRLDNISNSCQAIITAVAAIDRLAITQYMIYPLPLETFIPAVGQGAIGIEYKADHTWLADYLTPLNDSATQICVLTERAMNKKLDGNCHVPIGGYATIKNNNLQLMGYVGATDGSQILVAQATETAENFQALGQTVADDLIQQGARKLIATNH